MNQRSSHNGLLQRAIRSRNAQIRSWYNWYKAAKLHQKAGRYTRYQSEKAWRTADIARHRASIVTLKASLAVAKATLDSAKLALSGIKKGMDLTPIDLDPRVASLIVSKETANLALESARLPFKSVPFIDGDLAGRISMNLGIRGLSGTVSAELAGYPLLAGSLETNPALRACLTVPGFGNACTALQ